jgi:fluoride ion exporter CrcB/FEX
MRGPGATMFGMPDETKSKGSSFGIAQAAARCTASNTARRQKRPGKLLGTGVPWGTLIINVTASFLIGAFVGLFAAKWDLSQATRIFLTVGICGG